MKPGKIVLLAAIALFLVVLAVNFSQNASTYTDFTTAERTQRHVHIVGEWVRRGEAVYDKENDLFTFFMQDSLQRVEQVLYYDPKPMNFESAERVVVVGAFKQETFIADKIIMKCPSKYEETDITAGETASAR